MRGDSDPADRNGHGTHVAGTIGARRGNAVGVAGVTDGSPLMALRVLDAQGPGTVDHIIAAYAHAANEGAKVVNLSFGSEEFSRLELDAIADFPGVLFVAAAGNVGDDYLAPEYPCAYSVANLVCVAASDNRDQLASFSNFGARSVDLAAPGVDILSPVPGGGYDWAEVCAEDDTPGFEDPQLCFDAIAHTPGGAVTQPLIHWINRPTFQQAVEVGAP